MSHCTKLIKDKNIVLILTVIQYALPLSALCHSTTSVSLYVQHLKFLYLTNNAQVLHII